MWCSVVESEGFFQKALPSPLKQIFRGETCWYFLQIYNSKDRCFFQLLFKLVIGDEERDRESIGSCPWGRETSSGKKWSWGFDYFDQTQFLFQVITWNRSSKMASLLPQVSILFLLQLGTLQSIIANLNGLGRLPPMGKRFVQICFIHLEKRFKHIVQ